MCREKGRKVFMRVVITHACKMTFQARSTRVRDDGHAVLPRNVNDLHDIFSRVRIYYNAMRETYSEETSKCQPTMGNSLGRTAHQGDRRWRKTHEPAIDPHRLPLHPPRTAF